MFLEIVIFHLLCINVKALNQEELYLNNTMAIIGENTIDMKNPFFINECLHSPNGKSCKSRKKRNKQPPPNDTKNLESTAVFTTSKTTTSSSNTIFPMLTPDLQNYLFAKNFLNLKNSALSTLTEKPSKLLSKNTKKVEETTVFNVFTSTTTITTTHTKMQFTIYTPTDTADYIITVNPPDPKDFTSSISTSTEEVTPKTSALAETVPDSTETTPLSIYIQSSTEITPAFTEVTPHSTETKSTLIETQNLTETTPALIYTPNSTEISPNSTDTLSSKNVFISTEKFSSTEPYPTETTPASTETTPTSIIDLLSSTEITPELTDTTPGSTKTAPTSIGTQNSIKTTPEKSKSTPTSTETTPALIYAPNSTEISPNLSETTPALTDTTSGSTETLSSRNVFVSTEKPSSTEPYPTEPYPTETTPASTETTRSSIINIPSSTETTPTSIETQNQTETTPELLEATNSSTETTPALIHTPNLTETSSNSPETTLALTATTFDFTETLSSTNVFVATDNLSSSYPNSTETRPSFTETTPVSIESLTPTGPTSTEASASTKVSVSMREETPAPTIPVTSTEKSSTSHFCPDNFTPLADDKYCYLATEPIQYQSIKCPYVGNIYEDDLYESIHFGSPVWVPAKRKDNTLPYTWEVPSKFGMKVPYNTSTSGYSGNCLTYEKFKVLPANCLDKYAMICLYDLGILTGNSSELPATGYCFQKYQYQYATSGLDMKSCYFTVSGSNTERTGFCPTLAEPKEKYQAVKIFNLMQAFNFDLCWIGLQNKSGKYVWESNDMEVKYLDYIEDKPSTDAIYGASTSNNWYFTNDTINEISCAICEDFNDLSSKPIIFQLRLIPGGKVIFGEILNCNNVYNLEVYCFVGDKSKILTKMTVVILKFARNTFTIEVLTEYPQYHWCEALHILDGVTSISNVILAYNSENYANDYAVTISASIEPYSDPIDAIISTINKNHFPINREIKNTARPMRIIKYEEPTGDLLVLIHLSTFATTSNSILEKLKAGTFAYENLNVTKILNSFYCEAEKTNSFGDILTWSQTYIGSTVTPEELCLNSDYTPVTRTCLGDFEYGGEWSEVSGTCSKEVTIAETTKQLHSLLQSDASGLELSKNLSEITKLLEKKVAIIDVDFAAQVFQKISSFKDVDLEDVVASANNIMLSNKTTLQQAQELLNSTDNILYHLDKILLAQESGSVASQTILVKTTNLLTSNISGWSLHLRNDSKFEALPIFQGASLEEVINTSPDIAAFVPDEIIVQLKKLKATWTVKLIMTFFLNGALFNENKNSKKTCSHAVGILISGYEEIFLTPIPVLYKLDEDQEIKCGFWRYGLSNEQMSIKGQWAQNHIPDEASNNIKVCNFTHLTHFAMIVTDQKFSNLKDNILSIITVVGCSVSLFGIMLVFITALVFRTWRNKQGNIILLNFLLSVIFTYVALFVANAVPKGATCKLIAMLLHYSIISQFSWMLIISYLQYRRYVVVFNNHIPRLILKSCFLAWFMPVLPVVITFLTNPRAYHKNESSVCYLSGIYLKLGVLLPISIILFLNFVFFIFIITSLIRKKPEVAGSNEYVSVVKLLYFLFFLMGLSWIFGVISAFNDDSVVFAFLFCLTCSLQGFIVSLTYVLSSKTKFYWLNWKRSLMSFKKL